MSTSPAFQSDHLEFKGYEYRPNFEPQQQDYPAASVAQFLTAAYLLVRHWGKGRISAPGSGQSCFAKAH